MMKSIHLLMLLIVGFSVAVTAEPPAPQRDITYENQFANDLLVCGTAEHAADGTEIARAAWPANCRKIGLYVDADTFKPVGEFTTIDDVREAMQEGCDWFDGFDFEVFVTDDISDEVSQCYVAFVKLGNSTLAWSHLADGDCSPDKQQRYDLAKIGTKRKLVVTTAHEVGHLVGLRHRSGYFLMNPYLHFGLTELTPQDKRDVLALGYQLRQRPPPEPPTTDKVPDELVINGRRYRVVGGDEKPDPTRARLREALAAVEDESKEQNAQALYVVLGAFYRGLKDGSLSDDFVFQGVDRLSTALPSWKKFLELVQTMEDLRTATEVLTENKALPPILLKLLPIILEIIRTGKFDPVVLIPLIISLLS